MVKSAQDRNRTNYPQLPNLQCVIFRKDSLSSLLLYSKSELLRGLFGRAMIEKKPGYLRSQAILFSSLRTYRLSLLGLFYSGF